MRKLLKIEDKNSFIYYKNRKVRTPVTIEVENKELKTLILALRMAGIQKYTIGELSDKTDIPVKEILFHIDEDKEVIIEELGEEPTTILGKLMKGGD